MVRFGRLKMSTPKKIISKLFGYYNSPSFNELQQVPVEVSEMNGIRSLHIGTDTAQSSMQINDPFYLELNYTKVIALSMLFNATPSNILTIGLGGGSLPKFYFKYCPSSKITVLELHPQVISAAYTYFNLPKDPRLNVLQGDGIKYLVDSNKTYDILLSDAFDEYGIPDVFTTNEYFFLCKSKLSSQGIFIINLWGSDSNTPTYINRIKKVFNNLVLTAPSANPGNIIVVGFKNTPKELRISELKKKIKFLEKEIGIELMLYFNRLIESNTSVNAHRLNFI